MMLQEIPNLPVLASDPIPTPVDVVDATRTAYASGAYTVLVVVLLLGVARLLYWLAETYPTSSVVHTLHLGSSKVRAFLTGAIGLLSATFLEIGTTTGMDYGVLLGVAGATAALWLRPEPKGKPAEVLTYTPPPTPPANVPR
jgi:hypothetical protein